jgi:hypothetical protein
MIIATRLTGGNSCCQTNCQTRTPRAPPAYGAPSPPRRRAAATRPRAPYLGSQPGRYQPPSSETRVRENHCQLKSIRPRPSRSVLQGRGEAGILREEHSADDVHRDALQEQRHVGAEARRAGHPDDRHEQAPSVRHLQPSQPFNASISTRQTSDTRVQEQPRVQSARATTERRCTA